MARAAPSALITDIGQRVQLRLQGEYYDFSLQDLRACSGSLPVHPGWGSVSMATSCVLSSPRTSAASKGQLPNCSAVLPEGLPPKRSGQRLPAPLPWLPDQRLHAAVSLRGPPGPRHPFIRVAARGMMPQ